MVNLSVDTFIYILQNVLKIPCIMSRLSIKGGSLKFIVIHKQNWGELDPFVEHIIARGH